MTLLTYYPDTDTLDVTFCLPEGTTRETHKEAVGAAQRAARESEEKSRNVETKTYEADPSGQTLAHFRADRLEEFNHRVRKSSRPGGVGHQSAAAGSGAGRRDDRTPR